MPDVEPIQHVSSTRGVQTGTAPVSVVVLAMQAEATIAACLNRLQWAAQVLVVVTKQQQGIAAEARAFGAEVFELPDQDEPIGVASEWAARELPFAHDWVFIIESQHHVSRELAAEIAGIVKQNGSTSAEYRVASQTVFMGKVCKHVPTAGPDEARLVRRKRTNAPSSAQLKNPLIDAGLADVAAWVSKHNRLSSQEVVSQAARKKTHPAWRFFSDYILGGGFLDGVAGYHACRVLAWHDTFVAMKRVEQDFRKRMSAPSAASANDAGLPDDERMFRSSDLASAPRPPVSVVILTYNEESNIRSCIESCGWCDDIHVLDSGSKDRTREIAESLGAKVHVNPFKSFGQQRNWAIDNIPVKHRWQFQLDADEQFTPALVREMFERLKGDPSSPTGGSTDGASAYQCPSMMMLMGKWLRRAADYPVYQVRLIDKQRARFDDYGHGQREVVDGKVGVLDKPYLHHNFSKGFEEWIDKHNRYSTLEAEQAMKQPPLVIGRALRDVIRGDTVQRRRALKSIVYHLPMKSLIVRTYTLVLRRGFLDGVPGFTYATMRSLYQDMIAVKLAARRADESALNAERSATS